MLGLRTFGICSANAHFGLWQRQRVSVDIMIGVPAIQMRSCKNEAVVVGRLRLGWNEIIVLPFLLRIRYTERISSTRMRISAVRGPVRTKTNECLQVSTHWNVRLRVYVGQSSVCLGGCGGPTSAVACHGLTWTAGKSA